MSKYFVLRATVVIAVAYAIYFLVLPEVDKSRHLVVFLAGFILLMPAIALGAAGVLLAGVFAFLKYKWSTFLNLSKIFGSVGVVLGVVMTLVVAMQEDFLASIVDLARIVLK